MGIPDHLTCLLRNLYTGQEAIFRTGHGTTDWFQIGKVVCQGYILSPCLFNFYAEYKMRNAGLDEAQAGIKMPRRNINNLIYADDTTFMAESEELKSLLMKVKSESEVAQSCPTLSDPMDCSPPGSSIHGIFQARVLEWGAITSFRSSKKRAFQKNIYFCFIDYDAKTFDCVDHNKLWKIILEIGTPDHLTCLLRNLYVGQETSELDME